MAYHPTYCSDRNAMCWTAHPNGKDVCTRHQHVSGDHQSHDATGALVESAWTTTDPQEANIRLKCKQPSPSGLAYCDRTVDHDGAHMDFDQATGFLRRSWTDTVSTTPPPAGFFILDELHAGDRTAAVATQIEPQEKCLLPDHQGRPCQKPRWHNDGLFNHQG